jgi:hypothetical protein
MKNKQFFAGALFAIAGMAFASCDQKPPRKTLPSLSITDEIEGAYTPFQKDYPESNDVYAFNTSNVDMVTGGTTQACISIPMSDAGSDSAIIHLLDTYKPFAIPLLSQWSKQGRNGVVLDFRSANSKVLGDAGGRADYIMEKENSFSVPVIFLWDKTSESRALGYMTIFKAYTSESLVSVRKTETKQ